MGLLNKIRLSLAKSGAIKLEKHTNTYGFDEDFVESCIEGKGAEQFKYASDWLREDADFILKLVNKYPEVVQYCSDVVFDRFNDENGVLREEKVDKFFFLAMCCEKNLRVYKYVDKNFALDYMQAVKEGRTISGTYQGKEHSIVLENSEFVINKLLNIKYDIVKCGDLLNTIENGI